MAAMRTVGGRAKARPWAVGSGTGQPPGPWLLRPRPEKDLAVRASQGVQSLTQGPAGHEWMRRREVLMPSKGAKTPSRGPVRGTSDLRRADANGVAPPEQPDKIRNVALVGHSGAGKTMLTEALLAATGAIARKGSIADGTTVSDSDPAAIAQQRSVALAVVPVTAGEIKINLLDTPGYTDFIGELRAGLRAADAALFV